jgi:hypothetical protein
MPVRQDVAVKEAQGASITSSYAAIQRPCPAERASKRLMNIGIAKRDEAMFVSRQVILLHHDNAVLVTVQVLSFQSTQDSQQIFETTFVRTPAPEGNNNVQRATRR